MNVVARLKISINKSYYYYYRGCKSRPSTNTRNKKQSAPTFALRHEMFRPLHRQNAPTPTIATPSSRTPTYAGLFSERNRTHTPEADMFAIDEIGEIIEDVFARMSSVRSKQDLITVIIKVTAKYCFSHV
uniref:Uncharacterized protein n=1 Tax=Anopheles gambiae TaxID=7165 RepID=A0A0E4C797_ANOGA